MKTILTLIGLLVANASMVHAETELRGTPADLAQVITNIPKLVFVTGESEIRLPASRAVVNLVVVTEHKSLQESLRQNAELRARILGELNRSGIPAERVQASRFSSSPKYGMWSDKAKSYRVENTMRVSVLDEKEFRGVAKVIDTVPEANFGGVEFEYTDKESTKAKAVAEACKSAEIRKKIYEEQLGLKLVPSRFGEGTVAEKESTLLPRPSEYRDSLKLYSSAVQEAPSAFGEMIFSAKVTVEYQVVSK